MEPSCQLYAAKLRPGILNSSGGFEIFFSWFHVAYGVFFEVFFVWRQILALLAYRSIWDTFLDFYFTLLCHFLLAEHDAHLAQHCTLCYDSDCWTWRRQYSLRTTFYYIVSGLKGKNSSHDKSWFSLSSFRNEMWWVKVLFITSTYMTECIVHS